MALPSSRGRLEAPAQDSYAWQQKIESPVARWWMDGAPIAQISCEAALGCGERCGILHEQSRSSCVWLYMGNSVIACGAHDAKRLSANPAGLLTDVLR